MTKTVEVEQKLKELLQSNLTDPNTSRRNSEGEFVFTGKPKVTNEFPRIIISILNAEKTGFSIGTVDRLHRQRIQVSIQLGKKTEFDIDQDDELEGAGYVKNWLAEECDKIVQNNQDEFKNLGEDIFQLLPDSSNPTRPEGMQQVSNDYILLRKRD